MNTFTIEDLHERTNKLIQDAEDGKLSLVTKDRHPVFIAVPFNQTFIQQDLNKSLAINLYKEGTLTMAKAAKIADCSLGQFMEILGQLKIPVVDYDPSELNDEINIFK